MSLIACPHCGEVAVIIDGVGDRILLYLDNHDMEVRTKDEDYRPLVPREIAKALRTAEATTYKAMTQLLREGLISSPGKAHIGLRGAASYYVLTLKGKKAAEQLRTGGMR